MDGVGMITTAILLSSIPTNSSASSVSQDLCGNGTSVLHCRLIVGVGLIDIHSSVFPSMQALTQKLQ